MDSEEARLGDQPRGYVAWDVPVDSVYGKGIVELPGLEFGYARGHADPARPRKWSSRTAK